MNVTPPGEGTPTIPGTGVLLLNLGTPEAPRTAEVRRYLREFLGDPRVLTMNPIGRWLLLNLIILPFRPRKSAEAYAAIWTTEGSPLLTHSRDLTTAVQRQFGEDVPVELGMRYGKPSVRDALERLRSRGVTRLLTVPLYPQYATSTTLSSIEKVQREARRIPFPGGLDFIEDFYDHEGFIGSAAGVARSVLDEAAPDHVLFSFHGLPESQITALDTTGSHCLAREDCCAAVTDVNRRCYRAQSYAGARLIAGALGLAEDRYSVAFQSRLGRTPWIRPYADERIVELAERGVKHLAVLVPSFVADCLETLEEIGIRGRESFLEAGGEQFTLIPCVNSQPEWVRGLARIIREHPAWRATGA